MNNYITFSTNDWLVESRNSYRVSDDMAHPRYIMLKEEEDIKATRFYLQEKDESSSKVINEIYIGEIDLFGFEVREKIDKGEDIRLDMTYYT